MHAPPLGIALQQDTRVVHFVEQGGPLESKLVKDFSEELRKACSDGYTAGCRISWVCLDSALTIFPWNTASM